MASVTQTIIHQFFRRPGHPHHCEPLYPSPAICDCNQHLPIIHSSTPRPAGAHASNTSTSEIDVPRPQWLPPPTTIFCSFHVYRSPSLTWKLASYAYEHASRAYGVYDDLQGIKDTLSIISALLLDAKDKKKRQQNALREWIRQIQNICSDAEDVLGGFELQDKRKQVVKAFGSISMKGKVDEEAKEEMGYAASRDSCREDS